MRKPNWALLRMWVNFDILMTHDVRGPDWIVIFNGRWCSGPTRMCGWISTETPARKTMFQDFDSGHGKKQANQNRWSSLVFSVPLAYRVVLAPNLFFFLAQPPPKNIGVVSLLQIRVVRPKIATPFIFSDFNNFCFLIIIIFYNF